MFRAYLDIFRNGFAMVECFNDVVVVVLNVVGTISAGAPTALVGECASECVRIST